MALKIPFNPSEPGYWVSGAAHLALIAAALITLSAPRFPDVEEGIPVEIVTENQLSEITKGETAAKQAQPTPKPRADRVAEAVQQRDPGEDKRDAPAPPKRPPEMKVADRDEEVPAPPPRPEPKPDLAREEALKAEKAAAEALAREKAEAAAKAAAREKSEAAAREKAEAEAKAVAEAEARDKARSEAEAKRVAEARAKAEAEAEARRLDAKARAEAEAKAKAEADVKRVAEAKAKAEAEEKRVADAKADAEAKARKEAEAARKLDVGDLRQFLNKEKSQSAGATGAEVQKTASLGTAAGTAAKLNPSMRDALLGLLQDQILRCYSPPIGATMGNVTMPLLNLQFNPDGSLSAEPRIIRAGGSAADRAIAEAALRAVRRCAPYRVPAQFTPFYNEWKNMNALFEAPPA